MIQTNSLWKKFGRLDALRGLSFTVPQGSAWRPFFPDDPVGPDPLWRNGASLPFRDSSGLAHYPVDGSKLRESRAVIQVYRAQDHFIRNVVIPEVRLSEWEAEAPDR